MRLNLFLKLFLPIATAFIIFAIVIFLAVSGDIKNGNIGREQMAQIIFGGLFLLLTALALFLDFFVANPVNKIKEAIDKIRQGDFKQRIKISSGDAIGYLGRIFNEMMDNIQKSDEKIKEERRELQAILFSMGEGLLVLDRDLNILLINTTAEKLLGVPAKDAVGKQIKKVLALLKGDRELPMEEWPARRMLKSGKSVTVVIKDNIYYKTV
ncbi:cell wall metabolism sensor histidine kinase WalK, partial [Patescibacteria group bacterium]|nr:cell wall metabolism sensor histidine kinase WalK [Patescibacteria group bacterium]